MRWFGPYDDIRNIIVKANPLPPDKIAQEHEHDFIRDHDPPANADMTIAGHFGEGREDSLVARRAGRDIRQNTWISDTLWAFVHLGRAKTQAHAAPTRAREALEAAARAGCHVAKKSLIGVMRAANLNSIQWFCRHLSTGGLAHFAIPEHALTLRISARRQ